MTHAFVNSILVKNFYNLIMINDLRFELSFKSISQLENKLNFCISNNINKINIPCKGVIKKDFLNETIKYVGQNYKNLDNHLFFSHHYFY